MDNYISSFDSAQIEYLAERGFDLIRLGQPQEADALWSEHGLLEFFAGAED